MSDDYGGAEVMPAPATPSSSTAASNMEGKEEPEFDPCIPEDERRFYMKAYPTVDLVRERKVHCTICKAHIGTAPAMESIIKMHPVLRVTHCTKCHDFYNSGEFSKGEDGSELYCRWCGQGGEVYCCSSCPYVFCKSCITKNLSRGVVADIEQNENWNCFNCSTKILWPLRAQHWALVKYIEQQKRLIKDNSNLSDAEVKKLMAEDRSTCCRLAKAKCGNMSDSLESIDSSTSRRSVGGATIKKIHKPPTPHSIAPPAKRQKTSNDELVCEPDLLSMLEPDCQITESPKTSGMNRSVKTPSNSVPRIMTIQTNNSGYTLQAKTSAPPPLVLRNTSIKVNRAVPSSSTPIRQNVPQPRNPAPAQRSVPTTPVYHTINGFRIDLNSAAKHETFRLPNGKLIQVKRQGVGQQDGNSPIAGAQPVQNFQMQRTILPASQPRCIQFSSPSNGTPQFQPVSITSHVAQPPQQQPAVIRYHNTVISNNNPQVTVQNGSVHGVQVVNGIPSAPVQVTPVALQGPAAGRPKLVRHVFADSPFGQARTQLQAQIFGAMDICQHLANKIHSLTNSNAYKTARNYLEIKELYIHMSYLLTYGIGRFKGLQEKCLADMRQLGFVNDADCLENGQLAAGVDYVAYGQLDDVDLFNTGSNSFHNQVYEYRKSLHANLKEGEVEPLPPLFPIGLTKTEDSNDIKKFGNWQPKQEPMDEPENLTDQIDDDDTMNDDIGPDYYNNFTGSMNNCFESTNMDMYGNEEFLNAQEAHTFDRKLTKLIKPYPAIWCTKHPDYGNFEITRAYWIKIAAHFNPNENIKLRWKNIRKRYVRIEKRMREGKKFSGYFDKSMNFLVNRDVPESDWTEIEGGDDDDDEEEQKSMMDTLFEASIGKTGLTDKVMLKNEHGGIDGVSNGNSITKPIEVHPLDQKIIHFVKSHPVLWNKSSDAMCDKFDVQTRKSLWNYLKKTVPNFRSEELADRWLHLFEMYKTFRLKSIKDETKLTTLELKYSKYLAKLHFLYKIDDADLKNDFLPCDIDIDSLDSNENMGANNKTESTNGEKKEQVDGSNPSDKENKKQILLQELPDDREFVQQLIYVIRQYPTLWNSNDNDYNDLEVRNNFWKEVSVQLREFSHKQASDDEDNEIEIVEPKTDTITLDSDDEDTPPSRNQLSKSPQKTIQKSSGQSLLKPLSIPSQSLNGTTITIGNSTLHGNRPVQIQPAQILQTRAVIQPKVGIRQPQSLPRLQIVQTQSLTGSNNVAIRHPPPLAGVISNLSSSISVKPATSTTSANYSIDSSSSPNSTEFPENVDFMSAAQSFLASMLEVEISEGEGPATAPAPKSKKQPRKKTTNKPNPQLLELERQRLEEMKQNDTKLKMKCKVNIVKAEFVYPELKKIINDEKEEDEAKKQEFEKREEDDSILGVDSELQIVSISSREADELQDNIINDSDNNETEPVLEEVTSKAMEIGKEEEEGEEETLVTNENQETENLLNLDKSCPVLLVSSNEEETSETVDEELIIPDTSLDNLSNMETDKSVVDSSDKLNGQENTSNESSESLSTVSDTLTVENEKEKSLNEVSEVISILDKDDGQENKSKDSSESLNTVSDTITLENEEEKDKSMNEVTEVISILDKDDGQENKSNDSSESLNTVSDTITVENEKEKSLNEVTEVISILDKDDGQENKSTDSSESLNTASDTITVKNENEKSMNEVTPIVSTLEKDDGQESKSSGSPESLSTISDTVTGENENEKSLNEVTPVVSPLSNEKDESLQDEEKCTKLNDKPLEISDKVLDLSLVEDLNTNYIDKEEKLEEELQNNDVDMENIEESPIKEDSFVSSDLNNSCLADMSSATLEETVDLEEEPCKDTDKATNSPDKMDFEQSMDSIIEDVLLADVAIGNQKISKETDDQSESLAAVLENLDEVLKDKSDSSSTSNTFAAYENEFSENKPDAVSSSVTDIIEKLEEKLNNEEAQSIELNKLEDDVTTSSNTEYDINVDSNIKDSLDLISTTSKAADSLNFDQDSQRNEIETNSTIACDLSSC